MNANQFIIAVIVRIITQKNISTIIAGKIIILKTIITYPIPVITLSHITFVMIAIAMIASYDILAIACLTIWFIIEEITRGTINDMITINASISISNQFYRCISCHIFSFPQRE
jgi:hypothetical protein